jgi:5-methylcytosine-specific restriction endonuclease McrA
MSSKHWRQLRARRLAIDKGMCVVPGCGQRANTVDHIKRRRDGGADTIANTRSLCGAGTDQGSYAKFRNQKTHIRKTHCHASGSAPSIIL